MEEQLSIIIPVYNTEKYVEKCIQSILDQTYTNLEIICVDDGSTDSSGAILDDFAKKDARVKVIHQENAGVSAARNVALSVATGDWIGFIDSDDYINADMYQTMMQANAQQGADIISCGYFLEYENQCIPATNLKEVPSDAIETRRFLKYIYERDSYKGVASYLWTRLLKRELLFSDDGELMQEFSSEYDVSEDIVFLAHIMKNSKKSLYINRPMYYYLQRKDSACHDERKQLASLSWVRAYLEIIEVLKEEDIEQDVYNLVIRMIVYRCGKFMELAIKYQDNKAYDWLKDVVTKYYNIYVMTNREYPDRVEWLENLLIGMK